MNASTLRSRQQVVSRLMEASQSHQVSKSKGGISSYFVVKQNSDTVPQKKGKRQANTQETSLMSFFQPKKSKSSDLKSTSEPQRTNSVLNKASVILLEDVSFCCECILCTGEGVGTFFGCVLWAPHLHVPAQG